MCRLLSTITLSYRRRIRLRKVQCPAPWAPGPRVGARAGLGRSFLRCCRAESPGPARRPGHVSSHHDPTQQLPLSLRCRSRGRGQFSGHHFYPEPPTSRASLDPASELWSRSGRAGRGNLSRKWEQEQGKPRRPSYYIQCRAERSDRALAALISLPGRQPRRSSELRILGDPGEAGTGAASLLPRTTKKNVEVGAPLLCRALYGPQCPESSSYPLAPQSLKDRTVSWVCPTSEEVITCLPTNLEKLLSTQQKTSHVENGSV